MVVWSGCFVPEMTMFVTFAGKSLSSLFTGKGGEIEPGLMVCEMLVYING
nr:MAG TPA: hypothetical protein [Caudoviricetes sp.]